MEEAVEDGNEVEGKDHLLQRIKKEPGDVEQGEEDDESSTFQICVSASAPRQRDTEQSTVRVRE